MVFSENFFSSGASPSNPSGPGGGPDPKPGPAYPIGTSLRFRGKSTSDNTPKLSNANITCPLTFTYSAWCKFPHPQPARDAQATLFNQDGSGGTGKGPNLWLATSSTGTSQFSYYTTAGSATGYEGTPQFNDPSAWYHIVFTSPSNMLYVNGVAYKPQGNITLGDIDSVPFQIGSGFEAESWEQMDMILADIYFIDGQELSPTVFGEYNEIDVWEPIQPDFGKGQTRYSDFVYTDDQLSATPNFGATGKNFNPSYPPTAGFDGDTTTPFASAFANGWAIFRPEQPIPVTDKVEILAGFSAGGAIWANGADTGEVFAGSTTWVDLGDLGGTLTNLAGQATGDSSAGWRAIKVDGAILTDPNLWSAQLVRLDGTEPTGFTNIANAFDGDTNTSANGGANQHVKFAPAQGIPFNEKIEVWLDGPVGVPWYFYADGNDQPGSSPGGSTIDQWTTIYEGSGVIDANHMISGGALGTGWSLSGIRVDGKVLIDGANPSFGQAGFHLDFNEPHDPGRDVSGNENHFTANGDFDFVLKRSGDYADPTTTNYDQATNTVPTANGGAPYIIDIQDDLNSGTWCTYNPSGWSNGVTDGPGNTNGTYIGEPYAQFFSFDLRDFPTVTNAAVWSGWNQSAGGGNAHAQLLDENKNVIAGTRVNLQRHNDFSVRYELCDTDVGARYIQFDCSQSDSTVFIYGIEVNGGLLYQGDDFNPQYDLLFDSPTNNLPSFNPLWTETEQSLFSGNLAITTAQLTGGQANIRFPVGMTGKYYFEAFTYNTPENTPPALVLTNQLNTGILPNDDVMSQSNYSVITNAQYSNFSDTSATSHSATDKPIKIMAFGLDFDNQELRQYVNGELVNTDTTVNFNSELAINVQQKNNAYNTYQPSINFGQYPFYYEKPDGFTTLGARNLEDGDIVNGREHFQVVTGPGNGGYGLYYETTDFDEKLGIEDMTFAGNIPGNNALAQQFICDCFDLVETTTFTISSGWGWTGGNAQVYVSVDGSNDSWTMVSNDQTMGNGETVTVSHSSPFRYFKLNYKLVGQVNFGDITTDNAPILGRAKAVFPYGLWWIKDRTTNFNHQLIDHVRGNLALQSNTEQVEQAYSVPANDSVAWCWKAGDSVETNNDGSIETQVSTNTKAGFSIVTYTGNLTAAATIGHGLSQRPEFFMVKARNFSQDWHVGAPWIIGAANSLILNKVNEIADYNAWNGTPPDDSVITLGPVDGTNKSGEEYVAYCWHNVPGYCKIDSYYGNGDTFGPFNHTGFKPAFVMIKATGNAGFGWFMNDTTRKPYNPMKHPLTADSSAAEGDFGSALPNFLSNGFRLRGGSDQYNKNNQQYLYIAFAENPFSASVTAR